MNILRNRITHYRYRYRTCTGRLPCTLVPLRGRGRVCGRGRRVWRGGRRVGGRGRRVGREGCQVPGSRGGRTWRVDGGRPPGEHLLGDVGGHCSALKGARVGVGVGRMHRIAHRVDPILLDLIRGELPAFAHTSDCVESFLHHHDAVQAGVREVVHAHSVCDCVCVLPLELPRARLNRGWRSTPPPFLCRYTPRPVHVRITNLGARGEGGGVSKYGLEDATEPLVSV